MPCAGQQPCCRRGSLLNGQNRVEMSKTATKNGFTHKGAVPGSKRLTDECKRPHLETAGLAWKQEWEKDPLGFSVGILSSGSPQPHQVTPRLSPQFPGVLLVPASLH